MLLKNEEDTHSLDQCMERCNSGGCKGRDWRLHRTTTWIPAHQQSSISSLTPRVVVAAACARQSAAVATTPYHHPEVLSIALATEPSCTPLKYRVKCVYVFKVRVYYALVAESNGSVPARIRGDVD